METTKIVEPLIGDKLYQQRARLALPILVRQALVGKQIFYSDLASELEMPNARNLNYVLGFIGEALNNLSEKWDEEIPPIQCLVINKDTRLPGNGVEWFAFDLANFGQLPRNQQRQLVNAELHKIFSFQKWSQVLQVFGLEPNEANFNEIIKLASKFRGSGESRDHRELKEYVARHPEIIGIPNYVGFGETEHLLPSGDTLDVFFCKKNEHIGVEVKSHKSRLPDIARGLFQCVKYLAILKARQAAKRLPQNARAVLILENEFPDKLMPLKHILGVEVFDNVKVNKG